MVQEMEATPGSVVDLRAVSRSPVREYLLALLDEYRGLDEGELATYIPELAHADPSGFGICVVTTDGHVEAVGDAAHEFTIQSISKPFVFGMALEEHGRDAVLERVGVEPSGNPFNAIVVDDRSRPFNPMVNAGAIVATGLVGDHDGQGPMERIGVTFARYAGRSLRLDEAVYQSERATGARNRSIAWLMKSFGALDGEVSQVVDAYFRQCSLLVNCRDLATMAATLANRGTNPVTGEQALDPRYVENVLSVMSTCGMYDYAGEWVYTVGLPAKSGVSGGVVAVLPGQLGIGVFSPRLDARGNSARGIRVCQRLAADFDLHPLRFQPEVRHVVRRRYRCRDARSNRVRTPEAYDLLRARGDAIAVYELQGDLYFGASERLFRTVVEELAPGDHVVLDCGHLGVVDAAAVGMIADLRGAVAEVGGVLVWCDSIGSGALKGIGAPVFPDTDAALEWCEDRLLGREFGHDVDDLSALGDQELLRGLGPDELAAVEAVTVTRSASAGEVVFREGDAAHSLFFVRAGEVRVRLPLGGGARARRLASLGPGVAFGELALIGEGARSADVVVERDAVLTELPVDALRELSERFPELSVTVWANLAKNLASRLRRANEQVRMLAH